MDAAGECSALIEAEPALSRPLTEREALANALDLLEGSLGEALEPEDRARIEALLEKAGTDSPLAAVTRLDGALDVFWIGPDGALQTSIVIRTFVADGRRLTLHVGGGITWKSDPAAEWEETVAKAHGPLGAIGAVEVE